MAAEYRPPLAPPPQEQQKSKAVPWIIGGCAVLLLAAILLCVGIYGFYHWRNAKSTNDNGSSESPRTEGAQPSGETKNPQGPGSANLNQSPSAGTEGSEGIRTQRVVGQRHLFRLESQCTSCYRAITDIAGHIQRGGGTGPMKPRQPPLRREGANSWRRVAWEAHLFVTRSN